MSEDRFIPQSAGHNRKPAANWREMRTPRLATPATKRIDVHAASGAIEAHLAVDQRENRVVAAEPDVFSRQKFRAALADDDVAGDDRFAAKFFHAQPFADAVAAILDAALSFFMSHFRRVGVDALRLLFALLCFAAFFVSTELMLGDLHPRQFAAMPNRAVITFAARYLNAMTFLSLRCSTTSPVTFAPEIERAAMGQFVAVGVHQHVAKGHLLARDRHREDRHRSCRLPRRDTVCRQF